MALKPNLLSLPLSTQHTALTSMDTWARVIYASFEPMDYLRSLPHGVCILLAISLFLQLKNKYGDAFIRGNNGMFHNTQL